MGEFELATTGLPQATFRLNFCVQDILALIFLCACAHHQSQYCQHWIVNLVHPDLVL